MNDKAPDSAAAAKVAADHAEKAQAQHDARTAQHAKDQAAARVARQHQADADDLPGKGTEPAAPSGAKPHTEDGMAPPGQGDQVVLTGDAQAAARGGLHGDIEANTAARDEAIQAGHVEEGTTAAAAEGAVTGSPFTQPELDRLQEAAEREKRDAARKV